MLFKTPQASNREFIQLKPELVKKTPSVFIKNKAESTNSKILNRFEKVKTPFVKKRLKIVGVIKLKQSPEKLKDKDAMTPRTRMKNEKREKKMRRSGDVVLNDIDEK